ncbi:MAG: hypothetical protein R3C11_17210 [Planctomycetaceae bacterium]
MQQYEVELQEYEEKLAAYTKKKEEGQKKASENNERFANWYYVISEESFKKLQVPAEGLIQPIGEENDSAAPGGQPGLPPGLNLPNFNLPQGN